ncbi:MAG: hypothetical protein HYY06_33510 [Deltaproteobacteria bacterium]|nr:hypothetical protein [Deltaproteobacteria bacterium]
MARAVRMSLTGEPIAAEDALEIGLVDRVVAADRLIDEAKAEARRLAHAPLSAFAQSEGHHRHIDEPTEPPSLGPARGPPYHQSRVLRCRPSPPQRDLFERVASAQPSTSARRYTGIRPLAGIHPQTHPATWSPTPISLVSTALPHGVVAPPPRKRALDSVTRPTAARLVGRFVVVAPRTDCGEKCVAVFSYARELSRRHHGCSKLTSGGSGSSNCVVSVFTPLST